VHLVKCRSDETTAFLYRHYFAEISLFKLHCLKLWTFG
jgi:hypothetical protein